MKGTLFGVGVGPGDPELMTLKAVRMIRENEVIAVRSRNAGDLGTMTEKEFVDKLTKEITEKVC